VSLAQGDSHTFPETGKTVKGKFLTYWQQHGGLTQQGYPISEELQEASPTDGKTYTMQYFERAVFELHPENQAPNDVLLSLLGNFQYKQKYPSGPPNQKVSTAACTRKGWDKPASRAATTVARHKHTRARKRLVRLLVEVNIKKSPLYSEKCVQDREGANRRALDKLYNLSTQFALVRSG
jgi:hypothetical protein